MLTDRHRAAPDRAAIYNRSTNPKVQGLNGAVRSYVDFLYALA